MVSQPKPFPALQEMLLLAQKDLGKPRGDVSPLIESYVYRLMRGEMTGNDVVEMAVDEISTSASVGSGTDRAIGMVSPSGSDDEIKKVLRYQRLHPDRSIEEVAHLLFPDVDDRRRVLLKLNSRT
jgi:hypothetical protein